MKNVLLPVDHSKKKVGESDIGEIAQYYIPTSQQQFGFSS